mgnify:CR=1 FL=1
MVFKSQTVSSKNYTEILNLCYFTDGKFGISEIIFIVNYDSLLVSENQIIKIVEVVK